MLGEAFDDCLCLSLVSESNLHCNFADKVKAALKKQELDLAEMQKTALEKTRLADEKLASVTKLEEENTNLKAALDVANQEVSRLKSDKTTLNDKASELK